MIEATRSRGVKQIQPQFCGKPARLRSVLMGSVVVWALVSLSANPAQAIGAANAFGQLNASVTTPGGGPVTNVTVGPGCISGSSRAIIDWNAFNISSGETLQFLFPSRDSIALNRVSAGSATIDGTLLGIFDSNRDGLFNAGEQFGGNIWIYAHDGILFGPNSRVNVGGLLATTSNPNIDDDQFTFLNTPSNTSDFEFIPFIGNVIGAPSITVRSGADIRSWGGSLAFISRVVSTESGSTISTQNGNAPFGSAMFGGATHYHIRFQQTAANDLDLVAFDVPAPASDGSDAATPISLAGITRAGNVSVVSVDRTSVVAAVISAPGTIIATQASSVGGDVVLSGTGGRIAVDGNISASRNVSLRTSDLQSPGGAAVSDTSISVGGNVTAGGSVSIATLVTPTSITNGDASGGVTTTSNSNIAVAGTITAGNGPVGGNVALVAGAKSITITNNGNITGNVSAVANSNVAVGGSITVPTAGNVSLVAGSSSISVTNNGSITGTTTVASNSNIDVGGAISTGSGNISGVAGSPSVAVSGSNTVAAIASSDIHVGGSIGAAGGNTSTAGNVSLVAGEATISVSRGNTTGSFVASAISTIEAGAITASRSASLRAGNASISSSYAGVPPNSGSTAVSAIEVAGPIKALGTTDAYGVALLTNDATISVNGSAPDTASSSYATLSSITVTQPGNVSSQTNAGLATGLSRVTRSGSSSGTGIVASNDYISVSGLVSAIQNTELASNDIVIGGTIRAGGDANLHADPIDVLATGNVIASRDVFIGGGTFALSRFSYSPTDAIRIRGNVHADRDITVDGKGTIDVFGTGRLDGGRNVSVTLENCGCTGDRYINVAGNVAAGTGGASGNLSLSTLAAGGADILLSGNLTARGAASDQVVKLLSAGNITQSGSGAIAGNLTGSSLGNTTLNNQNLIGRLDAFQAGRDFSLTNAQSLTVRGNDVMGLGFIGVSAGAGNVSGDLTLRTANGDLILLGNLAAATAPAIQTVTLIVAGSIFQNGGIISANELIGSSGASASLNGANRIDVLEAFQSGGDFGLTNAKSVNVVGADVKGLGFTGVSAGTGNLALTTTGGSSNLTLAGNLTAGPASGNQTVALNSAGTIAQTGGRITTGILTGSSTGGTALNQPNQIDALNSFINTGDSGFVLTNARALMVNGPVSGGAGNLSLTTMGADSNLTVAGNLNAGQAAATGGGAAAANITITSAGGSVIQNGGTLSAPSVAINSNSDILIGDPTFTGAVAALPPNQINVVRRQPSMQPTATSNVFISAGVLVLQAPGKIVQQNTGTDANPDGIRISAAAPVIQSTSKPSVVDLFVRLTEGTTEIASGKVPFSDNVLVNGTNNNWRINGCVIHVFLSCSNRDFPNVLIFPLIDDGRGSYGSLVSSPRFSDIVILTPEDDSETIGNDPTVTGSGNDETSRNP